MEKLFIGNPWLALSALVGVVIVVCTAIVFVTDYLQKVRQSDIDASLKQEMIARGMSAADIKIILEARTDGEATRLALDGNQGVRLGMGKFQIEVGGLHKPASAMSSSTSSGAQV